VHHCRTAQQPYNATTKRVRVGPILLEQYIKAEVVVQLICQLTTYLRAYKY